MAKNAAIALGAVMVSLTAHGAVLAWITTAPDGGTATPEGAEGIPLIGQSFEDLATGTAQPVTASTSVAETATPTRAVPVTTSITNAAALPATSTTHTSTAVPTEAPTATTPPPTTASPPSTASVTTSAAPTAPTPRQTANVTTTASTAAETETTRISGQAVSPVQTPTEDTPRPQSRPPRPAPAPPPPTPAPQATQQQPQPQQQPQGNADRNAQAGATQGTAQGTTAQHQGDAQAAPGPSAREIARYPQLVNRHLRRLRRPNSNFAGTAVVGFRISANGGIASISVVRSSGDANFDALAVQHIRGAAPFPAPPSGAQTSFSVSVRGR